LVNRTVVGKSSVQADGGFPMSFLSPQYQPHMNAPDHEHILFQLDLANRFSHQVSGRINLTHLQRGSRAAGQSTRSGGANVIERGGARLGDC
jgi:hypothetical protein